MTKTLETMDPRCLDHDHNFPWMDLWDEDSEPTDEEQMNMRCFRCGETMRHSLQRMSKTLADMLVSTGPA